MWRVTEVDRLARQPFTTVISCNLDLGLDNLLKDIWKYMGFCRVVTKKRGAQPDLTDPIIIKNNATIETVCDTIHKSLKDKFKYALVWGKSSKFAPQMQKVGLSHVCAPDDVVSVVTST